MRQYFWNDTLFYTLAVEINISTAIDNCFFKPMKGVVPISSVEAEIFLQHCRNLIAKYVIQTR